MFSANGIVRLVADPELKEVGNTVVVNLRVVVDEKRKVDGKLVKTPHFFDMTAWDTAAKTISQYAKKGNRLLVNATPRVEQWEDKETKTKRSKVTFRVTSFELIDYNTPKEAAEAEGGVTAEQPF